LFIADEQVKAHILMESFLEKLPPNNTYVNFKFHDWIELGRMLAHAKGVISYSGPCAALSAYVGTRTLALYDVEEPQITGPFYFLADVSILGVSNPAVINRSRDPKVLKDRITFNMSEVFQRAWDFFGL
jgi:ADP-heptose:LPS heptosyltransferase